MLTLEHDIQLNNSLLSKAISTYDPTILLSDTNRLHTRHKTHGSGLQS